MDKADCEKIANFIKEDVDTYFESTLDQEHRAHLGASVIGEPCSRKLWYQFRNAVPNEIKATAKQTVGQKARIFERGHREEEYIFAYLEVLGFKFKATKEDQIRISDCGGHFGGSMDNICLLPPKFGLDDDVLVEIKTINGQDFDKLKKDGVKLFQPKHWAQICTYGYKYGLKFCLYVSVNKNTEELHIEFLILDWELGKIMIAKANAIIQSPVPLPKISLSPSHFSCKWCNFLNVCHYGEVMQKNCKTCVNSVPIDDAKWGCKLYQVIVPEDVVKKGCEKFEAIRS